MIVRCLVSLFASAAAAAGAAPEDREVRTRAALFRVAPFEQLPGWSADNALEARDALLNSCAVLARRDAWRELCDEARLLPAGDSGASRGWFERHFTALAVHKTDRSSVGDITGYFEPLVAGRRNREGTFVVPVYGVPRDMVTLDLRLVPKARRESTLLLRLEGRALVPAAPGEAGTIRIDLRGFGLDILDRRLRLRIENGLALPYRARAEIEAGLDAPVLAWLDDPIALYAMQVQGSGRVRMPGGATLRLQFAEQNGHPFRPLRIAAAQREGAQPQGVRTRGIAGADEEPERFELAVQDDAPMTRGIARRAATSEVEAVVDQLLGKAPGTRPAPRADASPRLVEGPARDARAARLAADPSYVFFRVAPDQSPRTGPIGAFGVPLTAGRSLAVDPRVTPLGYPVYVSARGADGTAIERLAFAQDTGGAIRGAVRADYFHGFGAQAGREAMRTRHAGRMWVLLPHAEAHAALATRPLTRGVGGVPQSARDCLLDDPEFCDH